VYLHKFGAGPDCQAWHEHMTRRDADVWQGATWLTESGGGSDLGRNVHTRAEATDGAWVLTGEKYFASNVGAEVAVVAARRDDAPAGIRGLGLYAMPRGRADGSLNYRVRRLKNKIATRSVPTGEVELDRAEALELAPPGEGIYPIMEILNVSRIANSIGSVACIQRALHEGWRFARTRRAFGTSVAEQPLFRRQLEQWQQTLADAFALAWAAADELDAVWLEQRPYSPRYHRFRLLAHLAKYWTAHQAIACARWAMEALGGNGAIADFGVERLLREAMILSIWEGTPHRQMLDGLEVMQREQAHEALFAWLGEPDGTAERRQRIEALLAQDEAVRSAGIEPVFDDLAAWVARCLSVRLPAAQ
jgi:alkylation response protein AidB-like acyl-CoA dehydrogenase